MKETIDPNNHVDTEQDPEQMTTKQDITTACCSSNHETAEFSIPVENAVSL